MANNKIPINYNKLKENVDKLITPEMRAFVESQIGKDELGLMTQEAWIDFLIGASLWGISVGITKIN